jgi:hypothetical protein
MFTGCVLMKDNKQTVAYLPSNVALLGSVIHFAGEYGWVVAQVGVELPPRLLPGQFRRGLMMRV